MSIFEPGEVVFHRRYGYRGVVYGLDPQFSGSDEWYERNQTQPDKGQPWYHVLVDNAQHSTYVAESNLEPDVNLEEISHPMLKEYFSRFENGKYY